MRKSSCIYTPQQNNIAQKNIITMLKLHDPCFYPLRPLISFREKSFLQLHMSLVVFLIHIILVCLTMKKYMENFQIILHYEYLGVHALFYELTLSEPSYLKIFLYVYY